MAFSLKKKEKWHMSQNLKGRGKQIHGKNSREVIHSAKPQKIQGQRKAMLIIFLRFVFLCFHGLKALWSKQKVGKDININSTAAWKKCFIDPWL